ncbi:MAG TPA: hypothetical protein VJN64_11545 [Terriglobales bacterium]|nr:hypothetical protein [Terriglobales bacterium]
MQRWFGFLLVAVGCGWLAQMHVADVHASHAFSFSVSDDAVSDDCAQHLHMGDDYRAAVRGEENRDLPNQALTITAAHNGGIQVTNWDKPQIAVKLCKEVLAGDEAAARRALGAITMEIGSGRIEVRTPESDDDDISVGTLLLVKAPKGAQLDMSAYNGGIALTSFTGNAKARTENGGIALKRSSGTLNVEAQNGGISIRDCGGEVNANVQNGGLSISLPERWDGKGLEAHTQNGGLVIAVPQNIATGVEVAGSEHTSIICKDNVCQNAQRTWDDDGRRILRFGSGASQVHATTVNGGIIVKRREQSNAEL